MAISRAQKKLCGGGNTAIDPAAPRSAITRRLLVLSGTSLRASPAAEPVLLPRVGGVAPDDPRRRCRAQALQARVVLVGHPRLVRRREHFLLNQVGALEDRELQRAVNTPSCTPGNAISRRAPLVFTSQPVTRYTADARLISSGLRGRPG